MIIKDIKFVDFDGNDRVEKAYFNLTQTELLEVAYSIPKEIEDGIGNDGTSKIDNDTAMKIVEKLGGARLLAFVKDLILKAYGEQSLDKRRFIKDEQRTKEFSQSLAFDALIMELMADDEYAQKFIASLVPNNNSNKVAIPAIQK